MANDGTDQASDMRRWSVCVKCGQDIYAKADYPDAWLHLDVTFHRAKPRRP